MLLQNILFNEEIYIRKIAIFGVTSAISILTISIIILPTVFVYIQHINSKLSYEVDFCNKQNLQLDYFFQNHYKTVRTRRQTKSRGGKRFMSRKLGEQLGGVARRFYDDELSNSFVAQYNMEPLHKITHTKFTEPQVASYVVNECCSCGIGLQGISGLDGKPGDDGGDGRPGRNGSDGREITTQEIENPCASIERCSTGPIGQSGFPGSKGEKGIAGLSGLNGVPGTVGVRGIMGKPGLKGDRGQPGSDGQRGPDGIQNIKENQLLPGIKGEIGAPGVPGQNGIPGKIGQPGLPGLEGARGFPGINGRMGVVGVKGSDGVNGEPGTCEDCDQIRTPPGYR